jgi:mannosyltransferase
MPSAMRKRPSFLLISFIWLALALRLFWLGKQSLWYDEGVTWYLTQFSPLGLIRWTAADIQPPFYYLLLWLTTRLFGQSEWALRFPSALFGVASVSLVWLLGRQLFRQAGGPWRQRASYLAALFLVASPLMVYYGQEARMYTLLVFQASLASYLILRFVSGSTSRWLIFSYVLVMTAALYTHYFAVFLLLGHAIYVSLLLLRLKVGGPVSDQWPIEFKEHTANDQYLFRRGLAMFLGVGLLFTPWIPVLLARLGDDPSYWPGVLKLTEVVQDVFISFAVGGKREMIFEADGLPLAAGFGLLLLLSLSLLLWRRPQARLAVLFSLLWLVLPISLILLLSYQTPKFNPRYTMLSWPAFALILAGGLSVVVDRRWQTVEGRRGESIDGRRSAVGRQVLSYSVLTIILLFVIFSWGFSLRNWFFVPEFSHDDFKHVAQFIRERSFLNEPVLLSSGHFFPVWLYYFGPDNWTPLPNMETLDVNRVTNFDIGPQLAAALQGQSGVWLVTWQDEVVDPNKVVPLLLDVVGQRTTDPLLIGQFWGVDLQYWHLRDPLNFPPDFPTTIPADANFGNLVRLRGLWQDKGDNNTEVVLFWEALQPLNEDYVISLRLVDEAGLPWSEGAQVARPAAYLYPTLRWPPQVIVPGRQTLPWLPGTPPGEYWLEVGWLTPDGQGIDILDENGNPQRRTVRLGPIRLTEPIPGLDLTSYPEGGRPFGALKLLAEQFESTEVEAGSKVMLETIWQMTDQSESEHLIFVGWRDEAGNFWPLAEPVSLSLRAIPPGTIFRTRDRLTTPYQVPPGEVTLQAQVISAEGGQTIKPVAGLTLRSTERTFAPPTDLDIKVGANFANLATLLGATLSQTDLSPDQSATLTLYWRAEGVFKADYTAFVHLLSPDGTPALNFDHFLPRPTTNWLEGEIVADPITLTIPADFPAGRYSLEVGLYNTADPNLARLARVDESTADYVILTEIEVVSP